MSSMSGSFREAMQFTSAEVIARRNDPVTEHKSGLATDWSINDGDTRVFAGIRGEDIHLTEVLLPDGSCRELPQVGHINFVGNDGSLEQNILTAEGEIWRLGAGQAFAYQLPDEAIDELLERARVQ